MLSRTWATLPRRRLRLPPLLGLQGSGLLAHMALHAQGALVVEGNRASVFVYQTRRRHYDRRYRAANISEPRLIRS